MFKLGRRSLGPALKAVRVSANTAAGERLELTASNRTHQRGAQYNSDGTLAFTNTSLRDYSNQYDTRLSCCDGPDFQQYGIGVPDGEVAKTAQEAETIAKKIGIYAHLKRLGPC
jgi:hypothetical protein